MPRTEPGSVLQWTREVEDTFVDLLIATFRNYDSLSCKPKDWHEMANALQREHNFCATAEKLQEKFSRLKSNYRKFEELLKQTGVGWDPFLQTITCSHEVRHKYEEGKRGYSVLLQQDFPHYEKLHEILRGKLATGGLAISSSRPPTPIELDAMEQTYLGNQANRRARKQPAVGSRESTGSSDSPPPTATLQTPPPRSKRLNRRCKSSDIRCDSIIGDALDMIRDYTNSLSPPATGTTKRSKTVSSPQKSESHPCMDLANKMVNDLTTDEFVDLMLLLKDDWHRTVFMNMGVLGNIELVKAWISKAKKIEVKLMTTMTCRKQEKNLPEFEHSLKRKAEAVVVEFSLVETVSLIE